MKRFVHKIGLYAMVLMVISNSIAWLSLYLIGNSSLYKPQFIKNSVKEMHFDYVVMGSSTGLTTIDTKLLDEKLQTTGLNCSIDDSSLTTQYLMLQYFLSLGKKTKKIILCVTPWDLESKQEKIGSNDYRFLSEIHNDFVYNHFERFEEGNLKLLTYSKYLPALGVSYYNNELFYPSIYAAIFPNKRNRFDEKGNYTYPSSTNDLKSEAIKEHHVSIINPSFYKFIQFCNFHSIEVVLYQSPLHQTKVVYPKDIGIQIINHSRFLSDLLLYDEIHVNAEGRRTCTLALVNELKN